MIGEIIDLYPRRQGQELRRTQRDAEALRKVANAVAMYDAGYLTAVEVMPWIRVEVRRAGFDSATAS